MTKLDLNWFSTDAGAQILQAFKQNGKLKKLGLLEKPAFAPQYSQYEEIGFKILLIGKSFCGKTTLIESLSQNKRASLDADITDYRETPGIDITHLYWPVKIQNTDKLFVFNMAMWDVGKLASAKYEYILPSCTENLDCFIFVFSWIDKQSFLEIYDNIKKIYFQSTEERNLPKLIIGTKFDQILHSDIEPELVEELEKLTKTKIVRFSSTDCGFDQISMIMNKLCDMLWQSHENN